MKRILLLIIILILMLGSCVSCRNESYIKESNNNATGVGTENDNNVEEASSVQDPDRIEVTSDKDNLKNKVTVLDVSEFVVTKNEPERIKEYESFNAQIDAINNSGINYCIAEIETEGYDFAVTFTADEWLNTLRISGKSFLRFSVLEVLENYGCDIAKGSKISAVQHLQLCEKTTGSQSAFYENIKKKNNITFEAVKENVEMDVNIDAATIDTNEWQICLDTNGVLLKEGEKYYALICTKDNSAYFTELFADTAGNGLESASHAQATTQRYLFRSKELYNYIIDKKILNLDNGVKIWQEL